MAATGGPPPPPRGGFENFSGSNGNSPPPELEMLHVTTSSSDALLPSQPILGRMNFLSAKNSVELHKSTIERKHSLPATFKPEDYEKLVLPTGSGPSSLFPPTTVTTHFTKKTRPPKTVGWADLDGRSIPRQSIESNPEETFQLIEPAQRMDLDHNNATDCVSNAKSTAAEDHCIQAKSSVTMVNILERSLNSMSTQDTFEQPEESFPAPISTDFDNSGPVLSKHVRNPIFGLEAELPPSLFDMNNYGSSGSHESISLQRENNEHVINQFDGLVNPIDIPRSMAENPPDGLFYKNESCIVNSAYGTPRNEQVTEVPGYPNMHTPPCREYNSSLHQNPMVQDRNNYGNNYDDDDEMLWPDKPQLYIPSINELIVPDPYFVSRTYPAEYHPFIATVYKKDCRTWLWKSARQREARLAEQQQKRNSDKSV